MRRERGRRPRRKVCAFCVDKVEQTRRNCAVSLPSAEKFYRVAFPATARNISVKLR